MTERYFGRFRRWGRGFFLGFVGVEFGGFVRFREGGVGLVLR